MKRLFLLALVCLQDLAMSTDYLLGRVLDTSNDEALPAVRDFCTSAKVSMLNIYRSDWPFRL